MFRSWKIGRAFGIPLYVHSTFLLLPAWVLYESIGAPWAIKALMLVALVVMFGCVVLHELGHALMARYFGIGTRDISLYPIGGIARLERMSEEPVKEIAIALAGPAVNVAIAVLLTLVLVVLIAAGGFSLGSIDDSGQVGLLPALGLFTIWLWVGNVGMILFNLIPAFPTDGGRVLRALLALGMGQLRATEVATRVGMFMAVPIALLSFLFGSPFPMVIALFLVLAGQMELAGLRRLHALRQQPVLDAIPVAGDPANAAPAAPRFADATGVLREPAGFTGYQWDARLKAWVLWRDGRPIASFGAHSD
jgi:Zn-dependent protease